MNFKKYHVSRNLINAQPFTIEGDSSSHYTTLLSRTLPTGTYTFSLNQDSNLTSAVRNTIRITIGGTTYFESPTDNYHLQSGQHKMTFTISDNSQGVEIVYWGNALSSDCSYSNIMLNSGSTPLPYEPYSSEVWHDIPHYIHNTSTGTITTLPAVLYPNAATATVGLKGQTLQSSIPSPTSPVMPEGTGDLETVGAKAGQYKIPISSANTTTPVYLGEVETTRKIKKLVLTGEENWGKDSNKDNIDDYFYTDIILDMSPSITPISSHFVSGKKDVVDSVWATGTTAIPRVVLEISKSYTGITSADDKNARLAKFKSYLSAQYAAGTPVCVWYVLATPETAVVNEPLMKIGTYADTLSNISIPVTAGGDTLSVDTTVQPSEVTVNYKGWHPVQSVHERESGAWT